MSFDVLITGGRIIDGTGAPAFGADLGVHGDRIAAVGRLESDADTVIAAPAIAAAVSVRR